MALEGNLRDFVLPEILQMVSRQRKTGILTIQGEEDIIAVSFLKGEVVAGDALNQSVEEGLGRVLAEEGLVSPGDFAVVASQQQSLGGRLIDLLVEKEYLSRGDLLGALRIQTYQLLLRLLQWQEGDFKFYSGDEVSYEEGFQPLPVEEVLVQATRTLGPGGPLDGELPELDSVFEPVEDQGEEAIRRADLSPEEEVILGRVDGRRAAAQLLRELEISDYRLLFDLYRLEKAGLIRRRAGAPLEAATPTPEIGGLPAAEAEGRPPAAAVAVPGEEAPPEPVPGALFGWVGRGLSLALTAAIAALLVTAPGHLFLPFPWQEPEREALAKERRGALYLKLDRAAKTFFLIEGRFPDDLARLVALGLLAPADLRDPQGRSLAYSPTAVGYEIQPVEGGESLFRLGKAEAITGNFLLDPEFVEVPGEPKAPALVLLD